MNQYPYGELEPTNLRMPEIKPYLYDAWGEIFKGEGYGYKKSDFSFKRKHGRDYEKFLFLFYNHFPLNYDVHFIFDVWNDEIEKIKSSIPKQKYVERFDFRTVFISQRKFEIGLINTSVQGDDTHFISTKDDLFNVATDTGLLLKDVAFPLANQLSTIEGIDDFFSAHPGWSVSSLSFNNISTELVAAKLNGKRNYYQVFDELHSKISEDSPAFIALENVFLHIKGI